MEQDLTQGSISKVLLRFVLPFLGASILQFLYSVVDMIIVGQFADAAAISAVNTSGQIMQLITGLISGIATGGTVLIGQHVGAKRYPSVSSVAQARLAGWLGLAHSGLSRREPFHHLHHAGSGSGSPAGSGLFAHYQPRDSFYRRI